MFVFAIANNYTHTHIRKENNLYLGNTKILFNILIMQKGKKTTTREEK